MNFGRHLSARLLHLHCFTHHLGHFHRHHFSPPHRSHHRHHHHLASLIDISDFAVALEEAASAAEEVVFVELITGSSGSSSRRLSWLGASILEVFELKGLQDRLQGRLLDFLVIQVPFEVHLLHHQNLQPYEWHVCVHGPRLCSDLGDSKDATATTNAAIKEVLKACHIYSSAQVGWSSTRYSFESSWTPPAPHPKSCVIAYGLASLNCSSASTHTYDRCSLEPASPQTHADLIDFSASDWSLTRHRRGHLWIFWWALHRTSCSALSLGVCSLGLLGLIHGRPSGHYLIPLF